MLEVQRRLKERDGEDPTLAEVAHELGCPTPVILAVLAEASGSRVHESRD